MRKLSPAIGFLLLLAACGADEARQRARSTLTIKGSDTMVILAQRWAERFMHTRPGTVLQVSGGGSGSGIAALLNGTTDVACASRAIEDAERRALRERRGVEMLEFPVAVDALAVYVHEDNPIRSLTVAQLAAIFRGHVRNWAELGGPDRPIVLYSRENNSGTYAFFKEHVLEGFDFAAEAQTLPGTSAVINAVAHDPNGIGYGGLGYGNRVRALAIATDGAPVAPTSANTHAGRYPLARDLMLVTAGEPRGIAADFIDWVRTAEGQSLVEVVGFFPLRMHAQRADRSGVSQQVAQRAQ